MKRTHLIARMALAALVALLVAPAAFGVGTGGTGLRIYAHGALSKIGGVVVNGITFDPSQASITINGEAGRSADDLQSGMVAGVYGNVVPGQQAGVANRIRVTRVVFGMVTQVDTGGTGQVGSGGTGQVGTGGTGQVGTGGTGLRIRVASIDIFPRADVVVAGCATLADVTVGTTLDVYGYSDGITGVVDATRIECVGPSGEVELHGVASAITPSSMVVDGVTVDISGAQFIGFAGPIAAGDRVEVEGTASATGIIAATVTFEPEGDDSPNGVDAEVEDAISAIISPLVFVVDTFEIDATSATFSRGTAADLAVGRVVHVEGTVVNGVINAKSVEFDDDEADDGGDGVAGPSSGPAIDDVDGAITAFTSVANFVVDGMTVDATAATFVNGVATDLAVGKKVEVLGTRTGMTMTATKVIFDSGMDGGETEDLDGAISAFTSVASFVVDGFTIDASAATFVNGVATDLAVGKSVKVLGTLTGMTMKATTVTFLTGSGGDDGMDGGGSGHHSGGGGSGGGTTPPGPSNPPPGGDDGDGHSGHGDGSSMDSAEVEGSVATLVSPGVFVVRGVTVDASNARISGGSLSDIREGTRVQATGTMQSNVLVATRVELDD